MSVFAFVWAVGPPPVTDATRPIVLGVALVLTALTLVLALRSRGNGTRDLAADWQRQYNRVALVEFAAIAVVVVGLVVLDAAELITPAVCLVVGAHFVPLATLFGQQVYRWTGFALVAVGLAGVVVAVAGDGDLARATTGFGAAAVLWLTSVVVSLAVDRSRVPVR